MADALIANFSKSFPGGTAIRGELNQPADGHSITVLFGPSGCGKTTILRCLAGLERPDQGTILFGEETWFDASRGICLPPQQRRVGFVFQDYALFPHLTVAGNVGFGLHRVSAAERTSRVQDVLRQVGMSDYARAYPHQLSGGMQQRVALARALAPRPRVMLLDEPFSGLDTRLREQIRDDALHVLKSSGTATLMVTHDPEEAMFMADRLAIMRAGRLEQQGSPVDVYSRPETAFVAAFFGQVNEFRGVVAGGAVATPLGSLEAARLADRTAVDVLVRPEELLLGAAGRSAVPPRWKARRLLGRSSWIHLILTHPIGGPGDGQAGHLHFHARDPGRYLPAEGEMHGSGL